MFPVNCVLNLHFIPSRLQKRDSVAVIEFLTKLEKEIKEGKHWTEISASDDLVKYRR